MKTIRHTILSAEFLASARPSYGGKADGLLFLAANGFRVPRFFILPYDLLADLLSEKGSVHDCVQEWMETNQINRDSFWAVRSSADVEDGRERSFAGLFRTSVNVLPAALPQAILHVLEGFREASALDYNNARNFSFHIILQEMLFPEFSGVAFSKDPLGATNEVVLDVIPGLGALLVSGEESSWQIRMGNDKITFSEGEIFHGRIFKEDYNAISVDRKTFREMVTPFLAELKKGMLRLEQLKGFPVDAEFAVAGGKLCWLQVRPVTFIEKKKVIAVWDNSNIGENYPGVTLPLSISLAKRAYGKSYAAMGRFLGTGKKFAEENESRLYNMVGDIYGAMYYNVTSWQQLLYQAPFGKKTSRLITRMWGTDDAAFDIPGTKPSAFSYLRLLANVSVAFLSFGRLRNKYIEVFPSIVKDYSNGQLNGKSREELIRLFEETDKNFAENWTAPTLNGFFTLLVFSSLKKVVSRSRLVEQYPNFVNDVLFSSGEVISVAIVRDLQTLMKTICGNDTAREIFAAQEDAAKIRQELEKHCPEIHRQIVHYIEKYGERCEEGELRMETVNYKEDPLRFFSMLKNNLSAASARTELPPFDYGAALRKAYPLNTFKRAFLRLLIRKTVDRVRDRENFRFMRTQFFASVRWIFRAIDHDLLTRGLIEQKGDSLYLRIEEILDVTTAGTYKEKIRQRKSEYERFRKMDRAYRYLQTENGFEAVERATDAKENALKGTGCCSGIVEGEVLLIDSGNVRTTDGQGRILVSKYFEPGWINLFAHASGLVSERGSLLSHTAILCREMGIPSVVGVAGISRKLKTGDRIRMNGATGQIEIITDGN